MYKEMIKLGVPEENTMVEMITNYISSMDSVKSVEATILLPEEEVVGTRMFGQILSGGLGLLQVAEAGVQASYDVAKGESLQMSRREIGYFLGMKYVTRVLDCTDTFEDLMLALLWMVGNIHMPDGKNLTIVVCYQNSKYEEEIYWETNEERMEKLLQKHDELIGGKLMLSFKEVRIDGSVVAEEKASIYPLQGMVELFVLLSMLLAAGGYGQKETAQMEAALFVKEKMKFRWIYLLASGTLTAMAGFVAILFTEDRRGFLTEPLILIGVLVFGALGVLIFSKLFKNPLTYLSWVATFVFCFLLLRFGVAGYITH